ncbi:hypothetical protein [Peribacillus alkalitolerans]|uniref:hypothetical protein n=1 Tax=Peribacillus alkalitolerans TaxID=1550385 RepID=UPI0013D83BB8|nr:hypothetical protein [Peribacillus alkalitolerans]
MEDKKVTLYRSRADEDDVKIYEPGRYEEETAAELTAPVIFGRDVDRRETVREEMSAGRGFGYTAIILSILSLFTLPILFGAAGIVLGFLAQRRGAVTLGAWAIGIGAFSIIIGIFILPFF